MKKIVLSSILFLVIISFVLYLIPGFFDTASAGGTAGVLLKVGDQSVTTMEVSRVAALIGQRQFPKGYPEMFKPFLMQRAAEQLMTQKALAYEAQRMGLKVTEDDLRDELHAEPYRETFFPKGTFIGEEKYKDMLASNGITIEQFEGEVKNDLLIRKLLAMVQAGAMVSDADVQQEYQRQNLKIKFDYAVISGDEVLKQIKPTDAELKAYFDKNKDRYTGAIPEKRKARYVVVDTAKIQAQNPAGVDELQRYYDQHRDQFRTGETANVRHILIQTPKPGPDGKVDPKTLEAARAKAEDVRKQLLAGAKFEDLAKKYSEDPGSAQKGGLYEGVVRGQMVPEFDQAAFSLPPGKISDLVKTSFGFHILRIDSRHPAHQKTLEEVKAQIKPQVAQEKAARLAESTAANIKSEAAKMGLEKAAAKYSLNPVNTDFFSRSDSLPDLGPAPEFMESVFSAREKSGINVARVPRGFVVFELLQVKPPAPPSFEEVRSRVESDFKSERSQPLLLSKTQQLSDRARVLHDLKAAARKAGATVKTSEFVGLTSQVPEIGAMNGSAAVAFSMKPGEISGPISAGQNAVVLSVSQRQEPPPASAAAIIDPVKESLLAKKRNQILELFASNLLNRLKKEGKIRYNDEEKARLMSPGGPRRG